MYKYKRDCTRHILKYKLFFCFIKGTHFQQQKRGPLDNWGRRREVVILKRLLKLNCNTSQLVAQWSLSQSCCVFILTSFFFPPFFLFFLFSLSSLHPLWTDWQAGKSSDTEWISFIRNLVCEASFLNIIHSLNPTFMDATRFLNFVFCIFSFIFHAFTHIT